MQKKLAGVALAALLSACGGGGGDAPPPAPAATFNLDAALTKALTGGMSVSGMRGQIGGETYFLALSYTPASDAAIGGATYKRAIQTVTISTAVAPLVSASSTIYFTTAPVYVAQAVGPDGANARYTPVAPLPTAATVGQSGTWSQAKMYPSVSSNTQGGTQTVSWSLEDSGTPGIAWACITYASNVSGVLSTENDCYRVDQAGNISGARGTLAFGDQVITFQ